MIQVANGPVIALDLGGSLAKIALYVPGDADTRPAAVLVKAFQEFFVESLSFYSHVIEGYIFLFTTPISETIDTVLSFIAEHHLPRSRCIPVLCCTGGGAHKFSRRLATHTRYDHIEAPHEIDMVVQGLSFMAMHGFKQQLSIVSLTPDKDVVLSSFSGVLPDLILAQIGTGISFVRVSHGVGKRVDGLALGGGTFLGLARIIAGRKLEFHEAMELATVGVAANADILIGDICSFDSNYLGLNMTKLAAALGKCQGERDDAHVADAIASLLQIICFNIAHVAALNARLAQCKHVLFAGSFICGYQLTQRYLCEALDWYFPSAISMFIKHDGFLGVIGALSYDPNFADTLQFPMGDINFTDDKEMQKATDVVIWK